jgi:predicted Co/Zn/Cd cation transporter (cation efflux family)
MNMTTIEVKTMGLILWAYLIMAVVGIGTFVFSNSDAVLIDGVFNFISALSMLAGIKIAKLVSQKPTKSQPLGFAMYETLYTLFKGVMIFGVIILAVISSITKIYVYITTGHSAHVNGKSILIYSFCMVVICLSVYLYLAYQSKKINNQSIMLHTEKIAVFQNTIISAAIGLVFLLIGFLENTILESIIPVTDSIVVLIMCVILISDPVKIIKNAFSELTIRDTHHDLRKKLIQATNSLLPESYNLSNISINRLGRTYYFVFLINPLKSSLPIDEMDTIREQIKKTIKTDAPYSFVDIIFSNKEEYELTGN